MTTAPLRLGLVGPVPPPNGGMAMQTAQLARLLAAECAVSRGEHVCFRINPHHFQLNAVKDLVAVGPTASAVDDFGIRRIARANLDRVQQHGFFGVTRGQERVYLGRCRPSTRFMNNDREPAQCLELGVVDG